MSGRRQRKKVRVKTQCPADTYTGPNEKIVEFGGEKAEQGGLISFRLSPDGKMLVDVYRQGKAVEVWVGKPDDF